VEDFVANNANIKAEIVAAVVAELTSTSTASGTALQKAAIGAALPVGTIVMWNGNENEAIPCGWREVEEMRGRFPVGANNVQSDELSIYAVGQTGGEEEHALTTEEMPPHQHRFANAAPNGSYYTSFYSMQSGSGDPMATMTATGGRDGVVVPHENRPPYYVVKFIKKISNCVDARNSYN
jgi:microcystin-dependent protein